MTRNLVRALGASLILVLLAPAPVASQEAAGGVELLDLQSLLLQVRTENPSLRAARLNAGALAMRPEQVSALPDPTVGAAYRPFAVDGIDGAAPARVGVQQMVPFPGKLRLMAEAATYGAERAHHETDALGLELEYQLKLSYYELFRIQEQERLIRTFQRQLHDFEEVAATKYEVGTGMQQAILKAQLERNALDRKRLDLSSMRRRHVERIARFTNRPNLAAEQGNIVLLRPTLDTKDGLSAADALHSRPELLAVHAGLNQSDALIAKARKDFMPDFMFGAGLMDMMSMGQPVRPFDNLTSRFGIEIGVVVPLQQGKRRAALEEARLQRRRLEAQLEVVQTEIETEFNDLQQRLEEDERALALYEGTLIPQSETTLEATLSAYTTGRTDFLDLLDAERMRFSLRMDYEATYADYVKTRAGLERVLAVGPLEDSAGPMSRLDDTE